MFIFKDVELNINISLEEYRAMWDKYAAKVLEGELTIKKATLEIKMHTWQTTLTFGIIKYYLHYFIGQSQATALKT